jgi:D-tyrosyl-tRNA(Tyr) deacylase
LKALVQRVSRAAVSADGEPLAEIGPGLLVLLGVGVGDTVESADRLASKVRSLRVFDDPEGRMNDALGERELLCVSQFTLYADTSRGNRPSFTAAAKPEQAEPIYLRFCDAVGAKRGRFGARMTVELTNDGPVTLMLEA